MNSVSKPRKTPLDNYRLIFFVVVFLQLLFAISGIEPEIFEKNYPDGPMRLLSVTDLLQGQPWFDTVQYRVMPPDGLDLHWSRLIDGAIAALILVFGVILSPEAARIAAIVVWPTLLLFAFIAIIGATAKAHFTPKTASFAIFAGAFSPFTYGIFFSPGALDHHNVQMVCMVALFWALAGEGRDMRHGLIGGAVAALSLAVGLEAVPFIALVMLLLLLRYLRGTPGADARMSAFGFSLGVAAPLFFVLQTGRQQWSDLHCDELAPPVLAITTAAAVLGVLLPRVASTGRPAWIRLLASAMGLILAGAVLAPLLQPCMIGPYSNVPVEVRQFVIANNTENYSILSYFLNAPEEGITYTLPFVILLALLISSIKGDLPGRDVRLLLVVFFVMALLGGVVQLRLLTSGFALLPLAFGVVAADFIAMRLRGARYLLRLALIFTLIFTPLVAKAMVAPFRQTTTAAAAPSGPIDFNCLKGNTVVPLAALEPAIIFTPLNLGPKVLQYTDHSVTGASYHRSPDAMVNGMVRYLGTRAEMEQAVAASAARYIIACRGQIYGSPESIGSQLATSMAIEGLRELSRPSEPIRIFEVLPDFIR